MFNKKNLKKTLLLASITLSGCANHSNIKPTKLEMPNSNALDELVSVSVETRDELRLLAKTQEAIAQKTMTKEQQEERFFKATTVPRGFEKIATFNFTGPASKAAHALAIATSHKFDCTNIPLENEPWVHISVIKQPLNEALKELGLQTGDQAVVQVFPEVLRLVYKK